jgi:crotonobetainyl-CoA:carnitine CoA-transferase CaiB-like acyl-CoA transferase
VSAGPFSGLKVIDCASFIAGPGAATLLGDFGAVVIKIEPPLGDPNRGLYKLLGVAELPARNFVWELGSRNKRSLAIDLKHADGQAVLQLLAAQADVFITNLPLQARRRLGIDAAGLRALNSRLIYASMTAYGETGPEADKGGFDVTAYWARTGLLDLMRADPAAPPVRSVAGLGDHPSATTLFAGISMALYRRERTGQGGEVSTSLLANGVWANAIQVQGQISGARFPPCEGRHAPANPLSNAYRCSDQRWLSLALIGEARQLQALLEVLGLGHLADDPRLASADARRTHSAALVALFDAAFARHDLATWRTRLDAAGITFGVIATLADIDDDVQMRAAGALRPFDHREGLTVASPLQLDGAPQRPPGAAPELGQHSIELLLEAGLDAAHIRQLIERAVVITPTTPAPSEETRA